MKIRADVTVQGENTFHLQEALPGKELRPGICQVTAVLQGPVEITFRNYHCQFCGGALVDQTCAPVLFDGLWRQLAPHDGEVCSRCMLARLPSPLTLADLPPCRVNLIWITQHRKSWLTHSEFPAWVERLR